MIVRCSLCFHRALFGKKKNTAVLLCIGCKESYCVEDNLPKHKSSVDHSATSPRDSSVNWVVKRSWASLKAVIDGSALWLLGTATACSVTAWHCNSQQCDCWVLPWDVTKQLIKDRYRLLKYFEKVLQNCKFEIKFSHKKSNSKCI